MGGKDRSVALVAEEELTFKRVKTATAAATATEIGSTYFFNDRFEVLAFERGGARPGP